MTPVAAGRGYEIGVEMTETAMAPAAPPRARPHVPEKAGVHASKPTENSRRTEEFLQSLARMVRQFHTYPAASPKCVDAVEECHRLLGGLDPDRLVLLVTPRELMVEGVAIGRGTVIGHELARRLYDARVVTVSIDRAATPRDLTTFAAVLVRCYYDAMRPAADQLREEGVDRIVIGSTYHPEVLALDAANIGPVLATQAQRLEDSAPGASHAYLYPPDKGWVRVDPGLPISSLSLTELALLVEDPVALAQMLTRLAADAPGDVAVGDALEQRFEDLARLFTALEPHVARTRFGRLAGAVLALDPARRRRLLSNTVLPGLVDGRPEGDVLTAFPDVELADALSLLLDVETAAPELLTSALDRLNLPSERRNIVGPLLEERIRSGAGAFQHRANETALAERTAQLIRVVSGEAGTLEDFSAFDLCVDDDAAVQIAAAREIIGIADSTSAQLLCIARVMALHANPEVVARLANVGTGVLGQLELEQRWAELAEGISRFRHAADRLRAASPDGAAAATTALEAFFDRQRLTRTVALYQAEGDGRAHANRIVAAAGPLLIPALLARLREGGVPRGLVQLLCDHASLFADALVTAFDQLPAAARIAVLRTLGDPGGRFERHIARQLDHDDAGVVREALRALARIGTDEAAHAVVSYLQRASAPARAAAEEALSRFAPEVRQSGMRMLLGHRRFVVQHPDVTLRLLERLGRPCPPALRDVLGPLTSLRFRVWRPSVVRVGRLAQTLLQA